MYAVWQVFFGVGGLWFLWLSSSKQRNIYPRTINSELVPRPPPTNHAHYLVHVVEEQMDEIFWGMCLLPLLISELQWHKYHGGYSFLSGIEVVRQLMHPRSLSTGEYHSFHSETRGHCSARARGVWFRIDPTTIFFTMNHNKSDHLQWWGR